VKETPRTETAD
jgi:hypothetical protein